MDGRFLLHVCCAPCLASALARLEPPVREQAEVFFYNPNIHPLLEFRRRVKALRVYCERESLSAEIDDGYGLAFYLDRVKWSGAGRRERCAGCYRLRLAVVAEKAREKGLRYFSTTLLSSREQDRDLLIAVGREVGLAHGVEFLVFDWRGGVENEADLRGIYRQQYCGCIFSEEERYRGTTKHLYFPGGVRGEDGNGVE